MQGALYLVTIGAGAAVTAWSDASRCVMELLKLATGDVVSAVRAFPHPPLMSPNVQASKFLAWGAVRRIASVRSGFMRPSATRAVAVGAAPEYSLYPLPGESIVDMVMNATECFNCKTKFK